MCFWDYLLSEYPNGFGGKDWDYHALSAHICFDCIKNFKKIVSKTDSGEFILNLGSDVILTLNKKCLARTTRAPWNLLGCQCVCP